MSPAYDHALMFVSTGNVTKTGLHPTSGLKIRGTPYKGYAARITVPSTPGLSAQILFEIHGSADDSTYRVVSTYEHGAQSWASGSKNFILPFVTGFKYVKLKFTITGGSTATSYGAVKAGIVQQVGDDWSRTVDWTR